MQDGIAPEKNPLVWDELKGSAVVTMGMREQAGACSSRQSQQLRERSPHVYIEVKSSFWELQELFHAPRTCTSCSIITRRDAVNFAIFRITAEMA